MESRTLNLVTRALDRSIAAAIGNEYHEIMWDELGAAYAYQTRAGIAEENRLVSSAVDSLHGSLKKLQPPNYDNPLVPLLYCAWFEPFQVNLAYSLIMCAVERRGGSLSDRAVLHVVDFGCGALAAELGVALALLDLIEQGRPIPTVRIDAIDTSHEMKEIGKAIWIRFATQIKQAGLMPANGLPLRTRLLEGSESVRFGGPEEYWLTAFHTFYRIYRTEVRDELRNLADRPDPSIALMTGYAGNKDVINFVSPFGATGGFVDLPRLQLSGVFDETTAWRQEKGKLIHDDSIWKDLFLTSTVEWIRPGWQDTIVYEYEAPRRSLPKYSDIDLEDLPF